MAGTTATGVSSTSESFGYDANNRLSSYNGQSLSYDNAGNVTTTDNGSTIAYDNADEITSVTQSGGSPTTYGYNTQGDRTSSGSAAYSYNQINELTGYNSGSTTATYVYDGNGQRTSKTVGGTTNNFVYDNAEGTSQILSDGTNNYVYGPGGTPVEQIAGSTATYLQQDQLGSTRVLTDQTRNTVGTYSYDAYGNTTSHTGTATTPLQYAGQYKDNESGLYWMRARYYDPTTASFMSVDPLAGLTKTAYQYTGNNPANATDPSGQKVCFSWSVKCVTGDVSAVSGTTSAVTGLIPGLEGVSLATGAVAFAADLIDCVHDTSECDPTVLVFDVLAIVPGFAAYRWADAAVRDEKTLEAITDLESVLSAKNEKALNEVFVKLAGQFGAINSTFAVGLGALANGEDPIAATEPPVSSPPTVCG